MPSADLEKAAATAVTARTQNAGQSCIALKRFIIEASIFEEFYERLCAAMAALSVGDPMDPATEMGPLNSAARARRGGRSGGRRPGQGSGRGVRGVVPEVPGFYYPATVLRDVTSNMRVFSEEVFGPVAVVEPAADLDQAIALANATVYGLGSSVWTNDEAERDRLINEVEAGQVFVNAMVASTPEMPFGGIKRSGYGRSSPNSASRSSVTPKESGSCEFLDTVSPRVCYLDHASTTPMWPEVVEDMAPFGSRFFGNASGGHQMARAARTALEEARERTAAALGSAPSEIVFTGGGTEADNLAVFGSARAPAGRREVLVASAVEHAAVLEPCRARAKANGWNERAVELREAPVDHNGAIDVGALEALLDDDVSFVSVMTANNEVGTIQPIGAVAAAVRDRSPGAVVHSDAVGAAAFVDLVPVVAVVDLVSISAHKLGGPKGAGALWVRQGRALTPMLFGGGQERERRSGTHNVAGAVGLATALEITTARRATETVRVAALRDRLADGLCAFDGVRESARRGTLLPGHCHVQFEGCEQEELLVLLDDAGVCASGGAACASGALEPSHVLVAMGVPATAARSAVRFTLGTPPRPMT